ncbi:hypothetical protein GCM10017620_07420 [Brevundimonas intermedia]|jgi:hypothetical protein|uniref:TIR domain-containing protein n=1 Tax=Brevundimonas intermedia TaxID=74315 RepID=A0ABQ5T4T2_9CAUL|nr:hypothetical protein GCM10017620_07420 [Brevundimonas intermedia]
MYLTEAQARARAGVAEDEPAHVLAFALALDSALSALTDRFDIFLSHSVRDASLVMGVKRILEEAGKTVYVDWISDPNLDRNAVTGATAERLRHRMRKCDACFYLFSRHSRRSRWMPWELGFFDGHNGNVAILPLIPPTGELDFTGEEYLEIYPKIDFANLSGSPSIFVNQVRRTEMGSYKSYDEWRRGADKLRPTT